jgi:hypothetical protein
MESFPVGKDGKKQNVIELLTESMHSQDKDSFRAKG